MFNFPVLRKTKESWFHRELRTELREFAMPLAFEIGAGTRRAGNAEVVRIQQDPRVTSKP
jgi:hypothetical protein